MIIEKLCEICKKEFQSWNSSQTCCSKKCKGKREYSKNKEKYSLKSRQWYRNNYEKALARRKAQYLANPEKWKAKAKEWR